MGRAKVLYLLLDIAAADVARSLPDVLRSLRGAWVCFDLVQLRSKGAPAGPFAAALSLLRRTVALEAGGTARMRRGARGLEPDTDGGRPLILANDRLDVALAAGADGVHVGVEDLPPERLRALPLPPGFVIGLTCHTGAELIDAPGRGADYAGIGTFFASPTKPGLLHDPRPALDALPAGYPLPLYAIGGLTRERAPEALSRPHVAGVVVSSAIQRAADPAREARAWRVLLDEFDGG